MGAPATTVDKDWLSAELHRVAAAFGDRGVDDTLVQGLWVCPMTGTCGRCCTCIWVLFRRPPG